MTDQPSLKQFLDELNNYADTDGPAAGGASRTALPPIGQVLEIAGSGSRVVMDAARMTELLEHSDP